LGEWIAASEVVKFCNSYSLRWVSFRSTPFQRRIVRSSALKVAVFVPTPKAITRIATLRAKFCIVNSDGHDDKIVSVPRLDSPGWTPFVGI
jgi:hypothetical protein